MNVHGIFFKPPIFNVFLGDQMEEVYKEKIYSRFVSTKKDLIILDVGANVGVTSYYFSHYAKKVYALEPSTEHFEVLQHMIKYNKLEKKIIPIKKALYIRDGKEILYMGSNRTCYSLNASVQVAEGGKATTENVETITIKSLLNEYGIPKVDFMKMDIEGNEPDVICHSDFEEVAPRIKIIVFETHTWSLRNPNQIMDALKKYGYTVEVIQVQGDTKLFAAVRYGN